MSSTPDSIDPQANNSQANNPQANNPQATDPDPIKPQISDPQIGDPQIGDPRVNDLQISDPQTIVASVHSEAGDRPTETSNHAPEQPVNPKPTPDQVQVSAGHWFSQNLRPVAIAFAIALLLRIFIAEPRFIPSASMIPTLDLGDRLIVEKVSYRLHAPQPGDIVVFSPPPQLQRLGFRADQAFIKRMIAQAGDTIAVRAGQLLVNETAQPEPYIAEPPQYDWGPVIVPDGAIVVMGDNRNNSNDSHVWGFLPVENVIGRAVFRFWPLDRIGLI